MAPLTRSAALAALLAALAGQAALGQQQPRQQGEEEEEESEPGINPGVGVEFHHDDNIYQTSDGELSSWIGILAPLITGRMERPNNDFEFTYEGEFGRYEENEADDYNDSSLGGSARFGMTRATQLDVDARLEREHEDRGSGLSQGVDPDLSNLPPTPDEYDFGHLGASFTIGSEGSKGQLVIEAGNEELDYVTNTGRTDAYDRDSSFYGLRFNYRFRPTLSLVLTALEADVDFTQDPVGTSSLDSVERRYRLGVTWDNDSSLEGTVLLGTFDRDQRDPFLDDYDGPSWEVNVRWSPRTYSTIEFATSQFIQETVGVGLFIDTRVASLNWTHSWSERLASTVSFFESDENHEASARFDDTSQRGIAVSYSARRWLRVDSGIDWVDRNSTVDRFAFDQLVFRIGAIMNF